MLKVRAGLRRENIDLGACEVRVVETLAEPDQGSLRPETPKSRAGRRTVAFPAQLVPELRWHLEQFAELGERGTLSAATGASLKELMAGLGHSSVRAAMMHQHATRARDRVIAVALANLIRQAADKPDQASAGSPGET